MLNACSNFQDGETIAFQGRTGPPIFENANLVTPIPEPFQSRFVQFLHLFSRALSVLLLLAVTTALILFGWYTLLAVQAGLYQFKLGIHFVFAFLLISITVITLIMGITLYLRNLHRRLVEAALKESEERYRLVVEGSNEGIWDWDISRNHTYWNSRLFEILGITPTQNLPMQGVFGERLHPDDAERVKQALRNHLEDNIPYEVEFRLLHTSGEYRYCFSRGKALFDERGIPVRMAGMLIDITNRKQTEHHLIKAKSEIEQASHQKDNYLMTLSQEAITSLNNILGFSQMVQADHLEPLGEPRNRYIQNIHYSGQALLNTLKQIQNVIEEEVSRIRIPHERIYLLPFIKELNELLYKPALQKKVELRFEVQPGLQFVEGDPKFLKQVLYLIASNGIQHNKEGGCLHIRIFKTGDNRSIIFQVQDTGIGISPKKLAALLNEPYSDREEIITLSALKKWVELQDGKLNIESTPDIGTLFTLTLPT